MRSSGKLTVLGLSLITLALAPAGGAERGAAPAPASPGPLSAGASSSPRVDPGVAAAVDRAGHAIVHLVYRGSHPLPENATAGQERAFRDEVDGSHRALRASLPRHGVKILHSHRYAFGAVADVDAEGLSALAKNPRIAWIYLDREVRQSLAEGVPLIKADVMHSLGYTGAGETVAILDTGIDWTHPALGGCFGPGCRVVDGYDFYNNDSDASDDGGHGTSVAGIVGANEPGLIGVAPDVHFVSLKVLAASGVGTFAAVDEAMDWVLTNRATYNIKAVNMSFGDSGQYDDPNDPICAASTTADFIRSAVNAGIAVAVASGNNGYDAGISFPACVPEATAIAGVYDADLGSVPWCVDKTCTAILCIDSTTGPDVFICRNNAGSLLDLMAPSWKATTTAMGGGTRDFGGTSAAAPYAAGAFALMFNALPGASVASVEGNLKAHGVPILHPASGRFFPRIDLQAALANFDPDVDGVPTGSDNCPSTYNPSQSDVDHDGLGDACDNCPAVYNPSQANADGDAAGAACDCDDTRANVYPGAPEVCDGVNNDCNAPGWPSLDVEIDHDGDGFAVCAGDCDDANPGRFPGNPEICDGVDNDCDGIVPPDELDADGDGFRTCDGDCDDAHATVHPGAPEICDGLDNDCDFIIPPTEVDADRDGWLVCQGDCDDTRRTVHPGAPEICDGLDDDCDGVTPANEMDRDSDRFMVCSGDCDDLDPEVYPGAPEICDGKNNDCNSPSWPSLSVETDDDGDGLSECAGDCDDTNPRVRPGRPDVCNDVDDDCDGRVDPNYPYLTFTPLLAIAKDPNGSDFEHFGASIAATGDLTGDGAPDLLVGEPGWPEGLQDRGAVLVVSGASREVVRRVTHPTGSSAAGLGSAVAAGADLDGDGRAEIIAGAPFQVVTAGRTAQGRVAVFSGATGTPIWTYEDGSLPSNAQLGASVARIGDLNGDGVPEVLAGAPGDCSGGFGCSGSVWILDGNTGSPLGFVSDPSDEPQEKFGTSVAAIGDVNGDGREDYAVGAPNLDTGGFFNAGAVLIFSGATGALLNVYSDPTPGPRDQLGYAIAAVADVDGDGRMEILAGAPGHTTVAGQDVGQSLLISGRTGSLIARLSDPNGAAGDRFGAAVAALPDIDRDKVPDLIVGAPFQDAPGAIDAGAVLLFSGRTGSLLSRILSSIPDEADQFGSAVAAAPPLDGDGLPEIAAGAPLDDDVPGQDAGTVTLFSPHVEGDCDGDGIPNAADTCTDADHDGYGTTAFGPPSACPADCDDDRATIHPGAPEICDGRDSDCDGFIPVAETDADGDGYPLCAGDCDDSRADVRPGAPQVCDGVNNDCNDPTWPTVSPNECFDVPGLLVTYPVGFVRLDWPVPSGGADRYRVYRSLRSDLLSGHNGGACLTTVTTNSAVFVDNPPAGGVIYYLVAGVRGNLEGSRGLDSSSRERDHSNVCP